MQKHILVTVLLAASFFPAGGQAARVSGQKTLEVLFIGNSFTGRHNLSELVKSMAEAGDPQLRFEVTTVLYGGRTLEDHWRLGSQDHVKIATLTPEEARATVKSLKEAISKNPKDHYAEAAIARHQKLISTLDSPRKKWDIVVLQSYKDDAEGERSPYFEYALKFAELAKAQGARVLLYETTPTTQNEHPLSVPPDPAPVLAKARAIAGLAKRIDAMVVPMSTVALHCQTVRPDLTLRYVNDGHLNQTMAYLTACTFYGALFDRSPEGLPITTVTDIRFFDDSQNDKDRDGGPITRTFSPAERAALQKLAWEGLQQFRQITLPWSARAEQVRLLDKPAYTLYTICSKPIKATPEDIRLLANNFALMHGKFNQEQMAAVRKLNPGFIFLTYINSTYTRSAEEVGPTESKSRHGVAMHLSATLGRPIGAEATRFAVLPVEESQSQAADGQPGIAIRASTIPGDVSSNDPAKPSTQHYVFWIRVGDEFMRVGKFDRKTGEIEVTRGFARTRGAAHDAGARVFSPIYLGFLRRVVTVDDEEQGAGKHPGDYPGGPGTRLRYVFDPAQDEGNLNKAELALQHIVEDGVDGIWMDTFNTGDFNLSDCRGRPVEPWNFATGAPYQKDDFRKGQERKVTFIQNYLKEKTGKYPYLFANNLKTATYYPGNGGMKLMLMPTEIKPRPLDGFCMEGGLVLNDLETWRARIQTLMDAAQNQLAAMPILGGAGAKSILGEADTPERDKRERFAYASYLLAVESGGKTMMGTYAFYQKDGKRSVKVHPIYYFPIGKPAETSKPEDIDNYLMKGGEVYGRRFTNGLVLINATPKSATVALNRDYLDPDSGKRIADVEIPAGTGKILLLNPGT